MLWPSGLRRWIQAPVLVGVGSNSTDINILIFVFLPSHNNLTTRFIPQTPLIDFSPQIQTLYYTFIQPTCTSYFILLVHIPFILSALLSSLISNHAPTPHFIQIIDYVFELLCFYIGYCILIFQSIIIVMIYCCIGDLLI